VAALLAVAVLVLPVQAQTQTPYGTLRDPAFQALPGAHADFGTYSGGAYRIEMPDAWNGGLVIFAHGYRGEGPDIFVTNSPIREHLIANGYAWAASSFRGNSYRPDWGVDDTLALRDLFIQRYGNPSWTMLHGQSMGGHVLIASIEQHPGVYQAAFAECGVLTGVGEFDFLAAYTAAADFISGVHLLDAATPAEFMAMVQQQWVPAMGSPGAYTHRGAQFDSVAKYLTGGDLPFRAQGVPEFYTRDLSDFPNPVVAPANAPALRALSTRDVTYEVDEGLGLSADDLNAGVRRYDPAPGARAGVFGDFTGAIDVPVLSIHDTGDEFVPFRHEEEYRQKALAAGTSDLLVQRAIRRAGHCNFTDAERNRAFDDLVAWMETGSRPAGDDVLTTDQARLGLAWTDPLEPDDPLAP
jgi:fermentation-respiration switch protein FrsA (DUF1100 family)